MYKHQHVKTVNNTYPRFSITDYVRNFMWDIRKKEGRVFRTNHYEEVMHMKTLLNDPKYTTFKSIRAFDRGIPHWNEQKVDCISSNLGGDRGYIFYFICNMCRRRVKHLYEYSVLESPLCRTCCGLGYDTKPSKAREFYRLLRKPCLSKEDKCIIITQAGITKEDLLVLSY